MASSTQRPTATIYQFPSQAALKSGLKLRADLKNEMEFDVVSTGAWYHEAAIVEQERLPKR